MPKLRVGIVGCGRMGRERARSSALAGARVTHVMDCDGTRAGLLAHEYGAEVAVSISSLNGCDAVFLSTPPHVRAGMARWAAATRIPFLAEKPLALDSLAAEEVERALARAPVVNAVGYMNRWRSSIRYGKALLASRQVLGFTAHWTGTRYKVPWWLEEAHSGGPHNEQASHLFDLARYLCGEITEAFPRAAPAGAGTMATTVATTLAFASGAIGNVLWSCGAAVKDVGLRVVTTEGSIAFSTWDFALSENTIGTAPPAACTEDIFRVETTAFLDAVRTGDGSGLLCTWPDANRTQRIMDDIRHTLRTAAAHMPGPLEPERMIS